MVKVNREPYPDLTSERIKEISTEFQRLKLRCELQAYEATKPKYVSAVPKDFPGFLHLLEQAKHTAQPVIGTAPSSEKPAGEVPAMPMQAPSTEKSESIEPEQTPVKGKQKRKRAGKNTQTAISAYIIKNWDCQLSQSVIAQHCSCSVETVKKNKEWKRYRDQTAGTKLAAGSTGKRRNGKVVNND